MFERLYYWLGYIALATVIFAVFYSYINGLSESEDFKGQAYSKDIALTINSMMVSDWEEEVRYVLDSEADVDVNDEVEVKYGVSIYTYPYLKKDGFNIETIEEENFLIIRKIKNE